ncbi:hypothetical protein E8E12_001059 [Didymella heteroderae]|uniref:Uncharacterized protein n=1 Tax=Didymella heteroderae TaxID=1769908 RepID=A0A9P4WVK0_9PLEO|nr:hypothetical protein E8E12_001059 [Didymella heteroderae]
MLPKFILKELAKLGKKAKLPDKVNVFVFCHGCHEGSLQIGSQALQMSELNETISNEFEFGVQVNVIVAACCSGILMDMIKDEDKTRRTVQVSAKAAQKSWSFARQSNSGNYRGSPFVSAYINSLMLEHFNHVNTAGISKLGDLVEEAQSYHDDFRNPLDALLNVFSHKYIVHTFKGGDPKNKVSRRFYTPPQPSPQPPPHTAVASASVVSEKRSAWTKAVQHEVDLLRTSFKDCPNSDKDFFQQITLLGETESNGEALELFKELLLGLRW